ncbi:MAG: LysR family transcriptional regulator [Proteobacteria bacterium]|nr:LysR family transcriptional regulator [Pseudomonadota bacterium]
MSVSFKQISAFLAVAEFGSFTRAAEHVGMAQPALSQLVRDLEATLGLRLFDRTTRRVELTEGGREFQAAASRILDDLDYATRSLRDLAGRKRGRIAIAVPPLLATVLLPTFVSRFHAQHPHIKVVIMDVAPKLLAESVRTGQADCGIGTFPPGEPGIERTPLARDKLAVYFSANENLPVDTIRWEELGQHPLITLTPDSGIRRLIEMGFETARIPFDPAFEVTNVATALSLVEVGLGYTVLPTYANAEARYRKLLVRTLVDPTISRDVVLIHASGRSLSPAVQAFIPVLQKYSRLLVPDPEV